MSILSPITNKVYAAAGAALLALALGLGGYATYLKLQLAHSETQYAQLKAAREQEDKERAMAAQADALEVKRMEAKHASVQQEVVHAFQVQQAADRDRARTQRAELDRLRDAIATYAAGDRREGEGDADACRSDRDRSQRLGADLGEALQLQGEAESFIRQRDREVKLLKDTISNDRELVK